MTFQLNEELEVLKKQHLKRALRRMETACEAETSVEGKRLLLFSSNNYLGLANDERLKQAAVSAINEFGVGSSGSRLTTGNMLIHEQLEQEIASWKQTESALLFSSGYLANIGTISALMGKGDLIISDELNHASIIDGCRLSKAKTLVYQHVNMKDLRNKLKESVQYRRVLIVTDGVFSMDGNIAPLREIVDQAEEFGAWVMVDDAHAAGVLGKHGRGTVEHLGLEGRVQLQVGTLSKAVGTEGGFVAASEEVIDYLKNHARSFIFQTALPPGTIGATRSSIQIIQQELERRMHLKALSDFFRSQLEEAGFDVVKGETPIIALVIGESERALGFSKRLEEEGVFAPAIRPPTVPVGSSRIRFTLMATHTREQVKKAVDKVVMIGKELNVI
ncbi:8-amino-7-oxononanoate synthase [Bacillus tianshenii]|nr:8-amino-7-oxononanoate synthase [Bacillus tianshenii]